MFILNGKRINIYAPFEQDGVRYHNLVDQATRTALGVAEIADPAPPADYSEDTYYRTEQDTAPYVVYIQKSPEQVAAARWEKVKAKRDDLITNGGVQVSGKWFHSDTHSKVQQLGLVLAGANLPAGIQWKTMDGSFVEMTPTLAQQIYAAQMAQEQAIFAVAETKRLDASDINAGWPATYTP